MATSQHINPWFWTPWCPRRIHAAPTRSMTPICFFCQSWLVDTHSLVVKHLYFTILTFLLLVRRLTHACCDVFCSLSALVGRLTLSWWESFPYCSFSVLVGNGKLSCWHLLLFLDLLRRVYYHQLKTDIRVVLVCWFVLIFGDQEWLIAA
jgi:hypothetical protein